MNNEYRRRRKEKKITIIRVSERTSISRTMISRFENGHSDLSLKNFQKLLKAIGCKIKIDDTETDINKLQTWRPV